MGKPAADLNEKMLQNYTINNQQLHVKIEGEGRPLLLVHGFPLDHSMWNHQIEHFASRMKVIAPDLIGYGKSELDAREPLTLKDYSNDLAQLVQILSLSSPVVFCGLSMGGYIGWQFLKDHGSLVDRFIQCNTRAAADDEKTARGRRLVAQQVLKHGVNEIASHMPLKLVSSNASPDLVDEIRQVIQSTPAETVAGGHLAMSTRPDMTNFLPNIQHPTLLIGGSGDAVTPSQEMRCVSQAIPNSQFIEIEGAGHMTPMEAPGEFNQLIETFLNSTNPTS